MSDTSQHAKPKKKGGVWRVVFIVALVVLIASLAALGVIAFSYWQGQTKYEEVVRDSGFDTDAVEDAQLSQVDVDWATLLASNEDTVAWLYIPNTVINYPVVQATDNEYYLYHDFDGDAGWLANYGAVFMDYRNNPDWSDQAYFIYGHHMNDGSMFSDLAGFTEQARFDECRTIYLLTPTGNFKLRTFAMLHVHADDTIVQENFESPVAMAEYVQDKIDKSVVDPGAIPRAIAIRKIFALATCDNLATDGRYILYAYVEDTSAEGLTGTLGLETSDGETTGFANGLTLEGQEGQES